MMNCSSPSPSPVSYSSEDWFLSETYPGVRFSIKRVSLGGRIALNEKLSTLLTKYEFLRAGDELDNTQANLADLMVRQLYLTWGLSAITGLKIDGVDASVDALIERGPEALSNEIVSTIRERLGLTESERKNS